MGTNVSQDIGGRWYLAQLKPGGFDRAVLNLERQGYQTFMPMREETNRRAGQWSKKNKPLFPGYLFVNVSDENPKWASINSTYGVSRLVALEAGHPTPVDLHLIQALQNRMSDEGQLIEPDALSVGDEVRVVSGPLTEKLAHIEAIPEKGRIYVLLDLMGRYARAELSAADVQAV